MKKILPTSQGFTLVELLVVISIIAILGTVGIIMFSGAQSNARDGKRLSDTNNIAKSLETSKDYTTTPGTYRNKLSEDFPSGIPTDPGTPFSYCIRTSNTVTQIPRPSVDYGTACPDNNWQVVSADMTFTGVVSWMVCSKKENRVGNSPDGMFCVHSLQQAELTPTPAP